MKRPLAIMLSLLLGMVVVGAAAVGGIWYFETGSKHHKQAMALTPAQSLALQVTLPQMLANLGDGGIIQFTLSLQASDNATKTEISDLQNQIDDYLIRTLKQYDSQTVNSAAGFKRMERTIETGINGMLPNGRVTQVYFSNEIVQPGG